MKRWYEQEGQEGALVVSSRVRLARNLADLPFAERMTKEDAARLNTRVLQAMEGLQLGENKLHTLKMETLSAVERQSLMERHSVSPNFIQHPEGKMLLLSEDESIAIMVNEEDHLRIQVMLSGLELQKAYTLCEQIDRVLDETLPIAFDENLGYLTSCPTNVGTGLRASVMMHLPALEKSGLISQLSNTISKLGLTIRGTYGEGSNVLGALYQISNQITLGITEQDSIANLQSVVLQIVESETKAEQALLQQNPDWEDSLYRSFGILKYARRLSGKEFYSHWSNVRFAAAQGMVKVPTGTLNCLMQQTGAATVCTGHAEVLSPAERDRARAKLVRDALRDITMEE